MKIKPDPLHRNVTLEIESPEETNLLAGQPPAFVQIKRILVPVDFSGCSKRAVQYAIAFARQFNADVLLLHVVQLDYAAIEMSPLDITAVERQIHESVRQRLTKFIEGLDVSHVSVEQRVLCGNVKKQILNEAQAYKPDLIIVGTHGETGLRHALLGSVAESVVRHANCPALTVREREHEIIDL
ncbi:MAG TPA: universal stress protein [Methylomirabilota bacterium]|nr:universal stress protein [Methylomirabilota bacterium]